MTLAKFLKWGEDIASTKGNLNDYVDEALPNIAAFMIDNFMDPMKIPDYLEGFSVKLLITFHGELELTNGILTNLRSLQRNSDFIVQYINDTNTLFKVSGDFEVNKIVFTYDFLAKIMRIGPRGGVFGTLSRASIFAEFLIDFNNDKIHLQEFYIYDVGTLNIKLTCHFLECITNSVVNVITTLFKNNIIKYVESNMKTALEDWIENINSNISFAKALIP